MTYQEEMTMMNACRIAYIVHRDHNRRDGKTPYYTHLQATVKRVSSPLEKAVAYLHDSLEYDPSSRTMLFDYELPSEVIDAVDLLTHDKEVPYMQYLSRLRGNPIAKKVKIADMLSNLADDPTDRQIVKYAKGLIYLVTGEAVR